MTDNDEPECRCGDHEHDCTHQRQEVSCHRNPALLCPTHFAATSGRVLEAALHQGGDARPFLVALDHLNSDGYLPAAYWTWMALLGRYSVPEGRTVEEVLAAIPTPPPPPEDAPEGAETVSHLVMFACRGAIASDGKTVAAVLDALVEMEPEVMSSVLMSLAASAHLCVDNADACTAEDVSLFHLLGSQVSDAVGFEVLPFLVDMVRAQQTGDTKTALEAFEKLLDLPGVAPVVVATDIVSRTMGQQISPNVTVVSTRGVPSDAASEVQGLVDVDSADPSNTHPDLMAGVWAVRAAQMYAAAADQDTAIDQVRELVRRHGRPFRYGMDVILGGTQMLGYMYAPEPADTA